MTKHVLRLKLLVVFIVTVFLPAFVHSEPACLECTLLENQNPLSAALRPGFSAICTVKQDLIFNLEQLSFYVKADCQKKNGSSQIGCQCCDPPPANHCVGCCKPPHACCPQNSLVLLRQLEKFNEFYAEHFDDLFCGAPRKE